MAVKHPYVTSSAGLSLTIAQLRRSFPASFGADTMKKLGIAPNNETYIINSLRFLGILDSEGKKGPAVGAVFSQHDDEDFQAGFSDIVRAAYNDLFNLHGENAWTLPTPKLIGYFRHTDGTSEIVGKRQASTFQSFGTLSGKIDGAKPPAPKAQRSEKVSTKPPRSKAAASRPIAPQQDEVQSSASIAVTPTSISPPVNASSNGGMALTVRVEINLPAGGDQETYDRIFKSIRENLLNGNVA
ncbi:hypothetical protein GRW89_11220 [Pseudomonas moraviensis]|uniref:DUF5343 domain-containing protein n=1 Tax=Pseudomonas moraviensis TaxID=321662 RepID=UPI00135D1C14|nr:DUF5343 domain-containing protein [Pseudomonas moraviensis]MXI47075.1 hypothetical protein [Pseudomonas moraviensis]